MRDLVEVAGRADELIGTCTGSDAGTVLTRHGSTAGDQLLGGRPVQAHVALGRVHGLRDPQTVAEQVTPKGQGGVPVNRGRSTRDVLSSRIWHDMGGSEDDPALE